MAFHEGDGDRYFGREAQLDPLWKLFRALHEGGHQAEPSEPSGCGKSSLARAGLIPELARRPLPAQQQARVAVLVPATHLVESLARELSALPYCL